MRSARAHMAGILERVRKEGCVVLLDFDGVLSPLVRDYRTARMSARTKTLLKECVRHFFVAIISGRALKDVKHRVEVRGILYAGNHGLEWQIGSRKFFAPVPQASLKALRVARKELSSVTKRFPGLLLEDKGTTLSVHYRTVPARLHSAVRAAVVRALALQVKKRTLAVIPGLRVINIRPNTNWNKGALARHLLQDSREAPVFIGDDVTDEDVFKILRDGITIRVGKKSGSAARYYFHRRAEVDAFLIKLVKGRRR